MRCRWPHWYRKVEVFSFAAKVGRAGVVELRRQGPVFPLSPPCLCARDFSHGVVEAQAQDLDEEVDGVAGQLALGPPPVTVLHD